MSELNLATQNVTHNMTDNAQANQPLDDMGNGSLAEFSSRLHEFLDFYQLFDAFINEFRAAVSCDSIEYEDKNTDTTLVNGYTGIHHCEYVLKYEGLSLGVIRITRDTRLQDQELDIIEAMLAGLTLPLKNALCYQKAIRTIQRDELTGLRNGSYYHDVVDLEIERAHRYKKPFSLLLIDLDDFEDINNKFGRTAGDTVLHEVARRMEIKARSSDVVYRNGGDEFLVFLPDTDNDEAIVAAERIKEFVLANACTYEENEISFTLSVGVVTVTHGDSAGKLIHRANGAMFHAKILGKDRIYAETFIEDDELTDNIRVDENICSESERNDEQSENRLF